MYIDQPRYKVLSSGIDGRPVRGISRSINQCDNPPVFDVDIKTINHVIGGGIHDASMRYIQLRCACFRPGVVICSGCTRMGAATPIANTMVLARR